MIPRVVPVLAPRAGRWPHAGAFYGLLDDGDPEGPWVAWAGRVGAPAGDASALEQAWRASRVVHRSLLRGGLPSRERRAAAQGIWQRLDPGLVLPGIGPLGVLEPDELHLLVVAGDRTGLALAGSGLGRVIAIGAGATWAEGDHPLTTARGLPRRAGVLSVDWHELRPLPPAFLVAVAPGDPVEPDPRALTASAGIVR